MNAVEIADAVSDLFQQPFNRDEFPFAFLEAFGNPAATIKRLRKGGTNASDVPGGLLQRNNIHLAVCEPGQVSATLTALRTSPRTAANKAKFILATDGEWLEAEDLNSGEPLATPYADFPAHFGLLLPLAGISTVAEIKDNPIDIRATGRLNKLYVELLKENPEWATEARRPDMNHFMARLIFCFFAEDTHIFPGGSGLFTSTLSQFTQADGSNVHEVMGHIFLAMNLKPGAREEAKIRSWADRFPYVNGGLFSGSLAVPHFSRIARSYLLRAGELNWREINPDIFGSMIQAVAEDEERSALGMHYTSVPNILKVLNPLFLDDLRAQLEAAGENGRMLLNLRRRMARIRVFDPACGSGNFLVIAYKEMRKIEAEINRRRREAERKTEIPLTNFRGIEIRDFAAEIARLSLVIAEYQEDVKYRGERLALAEFLPLDAENWIVCGNALRLDWLTICPPTGTGVKVHATDLFATPLEQAEIDFENEGGETYICGNPPYKGGTEQDVFEKSDMEGIFAANFPTWKSFDYILGFFQKARQFILSSQGSAAFVSTNSVCQGEQVYRFWPSCLANGIRISYAVTSFKWKNLASKNAAVTVCIVGLSVRPKTIRLFDGSEGNVREVDNINAYLIPFRDVYVKNETNPLNGMAPVVNGSKPADGGGLIFSKSVADELLAAAPHYSHVIRPFYGAHDGTHGTGRYCIWAGQDDYTALGEISEFRERFALVAEMRAKSEKELTQKGVDYPYRFQQIRQTGYETVFQIPRHSSETRQYYPVVILPQGAIVGDGAFSFYDPPLWNIAIFVSRLSLQWIGAVCGKIKTDFRFSNTLGWNTFPVPPLTESDKSDLTSCAEDILLAREAHFPATIADLYNPDNMPDDLRRAHDRNDETLERIYIGRRFKNDTERLEKLFEMYTKMMAAEPAAKKTKAKR